MASTRIANQAIRTVLPYTVFGSLWIWGSDSVVLWFTKDPATIAHISMYKGWAFIACTSVLLFVLVVRKLRIQQRLHQQLETRRQDLEEFLHASSHHLRTPLVTIHGFSAELKDQIELDELDKKSLKDIASRFLVASAQMEEIIKNINHLHRALRNDPSPLALDTASLIRKQFEQENLDYPGIDPSIQISPLPNCFFDPEQMNVTLHEILSNVFKHCRKQPNLQINVTENDRSRHSFTICFEDNGPGFAVPGDETLFHPAMRKPSKQDSSGLRIGLAIAWRCAKWNGGDLRVQSEKGLGTKVFLTIPIA